MGRECNFEKFELSPDFPTNEDTADRLRIFSDVDIGADPLDSLNAYLYSLVLSDVDMSLVMFWVIFGLESFSIVEYWVLVIDEIPLRGILGADLSFPSS